MDTSKRENRIHKNIKLKYFLELISLKITTFSESVINDGCILILTLIISRGMELGKDKDTKQIAKIQNDFMKKGHLNTGEKVESVFRNSAIRRSYIILTDQRLIIWGGYQKIPGQKDFKSNRELLVRKVHSIPYDKIESVTQRGRIAHADFEVCLGSYSYFIDTLNKNKAKQAVLAIEEKRSRSQLPQSVSEVDKTSISDVPDQLKKLKELFDSGILTEEEYQSKRKMLVDQL